MIKKNGDLEISTFGETLEDLKGMENLKEFGLDVLSHPLSKGILLLGVSGTGKSHYAKAIGKSIGLPTVSLSFGNMFDSLIGSSERKIKQALRICDAMSPLLLFIDELEKDLAGAQSSGETDSGVTKRVMKTFLTWLSDHESRVPIIATANSIKYVPPEFLRSERWDAIFFVNIPTEEEADAILSHYLDVYKIGASVADVRSKINMRNWTGSEIKALCRLGHIMGGDIEKSSKYVVPIYNAKKAEIDELRAEALQYAIPASGALDNVVKTKPTGASSQSRKIMGVSDSKTSTVKLAKKAAKKESEVN
jgi:SpoVK/Ycf46/Vps4 family AAA+-type ATPase